MVHQIMSDLSHPLAVKWLPVSEREVYVKREVSDKIIEEEERGLAAWSEIRYYLYSEGREIGFMIVDIAGRGAFIQDVGIDEEERGIGLGKFLYKTVINDLQRWGMNLQSDTERSVEAWHVWESLKKANPDVVYYDELHDRYVATDIVHRRPNVRRYRRQR